MLPEEIAALPLSLEAMFYETQDRIMTDVARRIKKTGEITSTADYQLNRYKILGGTNEMIEREIQRLTEKTDAEVWELYDQVIEKDYTRNAELYEQINGQFFQYGDPETEELQSIVTGIVNQTRGEIRRISRSMGFMLTVNGKPTFTPLAEVYNKYLDAACMDVVTGAFDYNTVCKRVVKELSRSGIRTIDYESGWTNRAPVAVRRAVVTGVNQVSAKINEKVGRELGTDYYEVTAHAGARPSHAEWQGRVYQYKELEQICGLGTVTGLCGANCRHAYYAFIPGLSTRAYSDEYLKRLKEEDARTETWKGKEYNGYERTQKARAYETAMRAQRAEIKGLKEAGAAKEDIQAAQAKYLGTMDEYKRFCSKMGLKPQMERVYVDGLGRMAGGRVPKSAIVAKAQKTVSNTESAAKSMELIKKQQDLYIKYGGLNNLMLKGTVEEMQAWQNLYKVTGKTEKDIQRLLIEDTKNWRRIFKNCTDSQMQPLTDHLLEVATDEELSALRFWTGASHVTINRYERFGGYIDDIAKNAAENIERVLSKTKIPKDMIVKRGTDAKQIFEKAPEGWEKDPSLLIGHTFKDKGFVATTPMEGGGLSGSITLYIKVPEGTNGAYINSVAYNEMEKELLLQKGYSYHILNAEHVPNVYFPDEKDLIVYVEVVS